MLPLKLLPIWNITTLHGGVTTLESCKLLKIFVALTRKWQLKIIILPCFCDAVKYTGDSWKNERTFYDNLMVVILMTRDTEEMWFESIRKQLLSFNGLHCYYYQLLSPTWRRFWEFARACNVAFGLEQYNFMYFGEKDPPKLPFMLAYKKHNAHVTQSCPKDRLLIYNCKSGWKPLCKFLGKDVPRKDFPWINKKSELANMIWEMPMFKKAKIEMLTNATLLFASVICAGYYFVKYS
ncbi:uncharacterized protein LOC120332880 [Styela clava]